MFVFTLQPVDKFTDTRQDLVAMIDDPSISQMKPALFLNCSMLLLLYFVKIETWDFFFIIHDFHKSVSVFRVKYL